MDQRRSIVTQVVFQRAVASIRADSPFFLLLMQIRRCVQWQAYKGSDKFIFFSYSHRDAREAIDVVEQLQKHGYNVWFDEGIDPGAEWDEMIARHIRDCA